MRWKDQTLYRCDKGKQRVKHGFLLFPKTIERQTRWLEFATWLEEVVFYEWSGSCWEPQEWVD